LSSLMSAASDDAKLQALRERSLRDSSALGGSFHGQSPTSGGNQQHPALRRMLSKAAMGSMSGSSHGLMRNSSVASISTSHHGPESGGPPPRAGAGMLGGRERTFSRTSSVASMQGFGRNRTSSGGSGSIGAVLRASFSPRTASVSSDASAVAWPPSRPVKSDDSSKRETISHI
jgi:hypothetical protein